MPFTPLFATGFEHASEKCNGVLANRQSSGGGFGITSVAANVKSGTYALNMIGSYHYRIVEVLNQTDIYVGFWIYLPTTYAFSGQPIFQAVLTDGLIVDVRQDVTARYDAYVNNVKVADGIIQLDDKYHHVQIHYNIGNAGAIQTMIDGVLDIDYSGDTQPGAVNTIDYFSIRRTSLGGGDYLDNLVVGTGGFPGDIRFDGLIPVADTATEQWTLSTGADSYALLDERPPTLTDYISTIVTGQQTIVEMSDWDDTDKTPLFGVAWAYTKKDDASAQQIKIIDSDGVATNVGSALDLLTTEEYRFKLLPTAPDGGAWTDADVDALQLGVESVIP